MMLMVAGHVSSARGATRAQIAIARMWAQQSGIAPIPGTTKLHRVQQNLGAAALELTPADLSTIAEALAQIPIVGERYPAALQARVGR